ncbi:MAG: hypothetical protein R3C53_27815 [Pirellulaceae bacterium]
MKPIRFSIRTLLFATTSLALIIAGLLWLTKDYRERRQAEERLRSTGAVYAYVNEDRVATVVFNQPITTKDLGKVKSIERVELQGFAVDDSTLSRLCELEKVDSLMVQSCTLDHVEALSRLERIPKLKWLLFWNTPISDEAVEALSKLQQLEGLSFKNTNLTPAGLSKLQEAMPGVKIDSRP